MVIAEQHLENATSTTMLHNHRDLWRSPRGTVLRIEALAMVAIILSFFLATFGSCRRWSNRWIVQKGFLVAQVLSLSLGTYSIGLMQSSPVKSEMYPIWAVSLFTLFGCIDPITTYIGLDYKGPLLKTIFQLCLYCGYVLLMSFTTISGVVGILAITMLSVITFIKGFHRSLALVRPSIMHKVMEGLDYIETPALAGDCKGVKVDLAMLHYDTECLGYSMSNPSATMDNIHRHMGELQLAEVVTDNGLTIEDVCLGYSLSHFLQWRFLGRDYSKKVEEKKNYFESLVRDDGSHGINYMRTMKVIEVELAFLYEAYFSSNEFLHFYQAKTASFWAFASFVGICFVGVAVAIPGSVAGRRHSTSGASIVTMTTTDLIITLAILVSLALLQLVQLMRCWTSNWALVLSACECSRDPGLWRFKEGVQVCLQRCAQIISSSKKEQIRQWWMKLKASAVTGNNWFDKHLWQDQLGQYSLVVAAARPRSSRTECAARGLECTAQACFCDFCLCCPAWIQFLRLSWELFVLNLGGKYIQWVLRDVLLSDTENNTGPAVRLNDDVKMSIADFLGQIKSRRIGRKDCWSSLFVDNGIDASCLPYSNAPRGPFTPDDVRAFTRRVLMWHIATCYCELKEQEAAGGEANHSDSREKKNTNRRVAVALSNYCVYLAASAPELLPGASVEAKLTFEVARMETSWALVRAGEGNMLEAMQRHWQRSGYIYGVPSITTGDNIFEAGVYWGKRLLNETPPPRECPGCSDDHWKLLALLWVQTLLYAAPYGDVQRHRQHLSQGGEFITHLWALLYHIGIDKWEREEEDAAETSQAVGGEAEIRETSN